MYIDCPKIYMSYVIDIYYLEIDINIIYDDHILALNKDKKG